jgi:hypothetical protein
MYTRTKFMEVSGTETAKLVAAELVRRSMWFACEPMPDDVFEFRVKEEALVFLKQAITLLPAGPQNAASSAPSPGRV